MQGTVTRLRPRGVEATMDSPTDSLDMGTAFRIYRLVDGLPVEVGTGYSKRSKGPNLICLNPADGAELVDPQVGDLVESI